MVTVFEVQYQTAGPSSYQIDYYITSVIATLMRKLVVVAVVA
jgi:hypothetical protein